MTVNLRVSFLVFMKKFWLIWKCRRQGRIKVVWGPWLKLRRGPYSGVRRKFSWRGSFSGIWCSFFCGVRSLWHHNLRSYSCFQTNVLAKCVDITRIFFYTPSPHFMRHCTEYKLSALQVRVSEENNSMLRHRSW